MIGKLSSSFGSEAERQAVYELQHKLEDALKAQGTGMCDGNEMGDGEFRFYLYGPDADRMFATIERTLRAANAPIVQVMKRYGEIGARQAILNWRDGTATIVPADK